MKQKLSILLILTLLLSLFAGCTPDDVPSSGDSPVNTGTSDSASATDSGSDASSETDSQNSNTDEAEVVEVYRNATGYTYSFQERAHDCTDKKSHEVSNAFGLDRVSVEYLIDGKFYPLNYCNHDLAETDLAWAYPSLKDKGVLIVNDPSATKRDSPLFPCHVRAMNISAGQGTPVAITFTAKYETRLSVDFLAPIFSGSIYGEGAEVHKIEFYLNDTRISMDDILHEKKNIQEAVLSYTPLPSSGNGIIILDPNDGKVHLRENGDGVSLKPGDQFRILLTFLKSDHIPVDKSGQYRKALDISNVKFYVKEYGIPVPEDVSALVSQIKQGQSLEDLKAILGEPQRSSAPPADWRPSEGITREWSAEWRRGEEIIRVNFEDEAIKSISLTYLPQDTRWVDYGNSGK